MSKISDTSNTTVVKIFINSLAVAGLAVAPSLSLAQTTTTPATATTPTTTATQTTPQQAVNPFNFTVEDPSAKHCQQAQDGIKESNRKIAEACRKAGLGGSKNCTEKAKSCNEEIEDGNEVKSPDLLGTITQGANMFLGNQALNVPAQNQSGCPQLNGRDYFTEKDKIQTQLKDTKEALAKLDEERADAKKDYDEAIKEIQETLAKAQEEVKEKTLEIDQDLRQQIGDFQKSQAEAQKAMRDQGSALLDLRGKLIALDRQKAQELLNLTDFTAKAECKRKMYELNAAYKAVSAGTSSGHINRAKAKKAELIETYNKCMVGFSEKRKALNEGYKQQRAVIEKQIANTEEDVKAVEDGLKTSESQLEEIKTAANTKKQNALQSVIDLGNRSQTQMEAAYAQLQTKSSAINKKETSLNEALNQANSSLSTLGPAPKRGTEYSPADASSEIDTELQNLRSYTTAASLCEDAKQAAGNVLKSYGERSSSSRTSRGTN